MSARQGLLTAHEAWMSALPSLLVGELDGQGNQQGLTISHQARVGRNSGSAAYCAECRIQPQARVWSFLSSNFIPQHNPLRLSAFPDNSFNGRETCPIQWINGPFHISMEA